MDKIAIIITTFLRDNLLYKTIQTIMNNLPEKCIILIGDQNPTEQKLHQYSLKNIYYYGLPYDCGLSFSRNYLVEKAACLGIDYVLISADSIPFNKKYDFNPIIEFLKQNENYGLVGLSDNSLPWNVDMKLIPGAHWALDIPRKSPLFYQDSKFQPCDMVGNFFLAKTECLLENKWKNELKLCEHESFFYDLSLTKWKVFYTDYIVAQHIIAHTEPLYDSYRKRIYGEFRTKLQEIYGIKGWVTYSSDLKQAFARWKIATKR